MYKVGHKVTRKAHKKNCGLTVCYFVVWEVFVVKIEDISPRLRENNQNNKKTFPVVFALKTALFNLIDCHKIDLDF